MTTEDLKGAVKEVFDTGKEVVDTAKDRFKSPLLSSFIISTIVLLWEPILVLILSKKEIEERIIYINDTFQYEWYLFLIPVSVAFIYVLGIPYAKWGIDIALNRPNQGINTNKRKQEHLEYVANIQNQDEKNRLLNRKNTDEKIDNLNKELKNREKEIENLNQKNESLQEELTKRLDREQNLELQTKGLKNEFEHLMSEYNSLKENPKLKFRDLQQEYTVFQNSELFKYLPEIGEWLTNGKKMMTDSEVENIDYMKMVNIYKEAGLIEENYEELGMYRFTKKGKIYYDLYKSSNAIKNSSKEINAFFKQQINFNNLGYNSDNSIENKNY